MKKSAEEKKKKKARVNNFTETRITMQANSAIIERKYMVGSVWTFARISKRVSLFDSPIIVIYVADKPIICVVILP